MKRVSHKYGVQLPSTVQEAFDINGENGNTLLCDALKKDTENLKVTFEIIPDGESPLVQYTKASGHLIFGVTMTLEGKDRYVKDGHKTPQPEWSTFAGVSSREIIRTALTYAAMNDLPVFGAEIQNSYLQASSSGRN